ncbi:MAG: glutamine--tRNA ligase/YqeY domain fusion protein [Flavobacteriaceae bacterium]|nr:glutamine--tRNA ligase/YqeY domain fusion protein [Flavobacteriaceae bacterium]
MLEKKTPLNFIEHIIEEDLANGMPKGNLRFRFPPEPNGYLHIGHTKAIGISFGLGKKYDAPVNLRFDDTNPAKEEQKYVDAIKKDIAWMGYQWDQELYSSDYFQILYDWAIRFIKNEKAYIDSQSSEEMRTQKGTPTQVGTNSPYRNRPIEENLDLFKKMKEGAFSEGTHVLRAKIDMEDPNMLMRDPIMYRVLKKRHHRTGNDWCIFPMYDWTHGESDYIEQISHSLCSLEFKPHRKLYNWFRDEVYNENSREFPLAPKQLEFARLNLSYTVMSKRKLFQLVEENIVKGWDDPRMPTISGLRRRGYTSNAIKKFIEVVGVAKRENVIDVSFLEFCIREDLNKTAPRVMAVLNPVKLIITNYPEDKEELLKVENNPEDKNAGFREVPFSKELYIEREDFKEAASDNFFRLSPGKEVRLKNAYIIKADSVLKDSQGNITELLCTYDADSLSGTGTEASIRKVKGTLHWVSIAHALKTEIRSYDRLFTDEAPDSHKDKTFMDFINPNSLKVTEAFVEPSLASAKKGDSFQFQRLGYFNVDDDTTSKNTVFNKTVGLRDSWSKKKPAQTQVKQAQIPQVSSVNEIMRFGKKYTNLPIEKQELAKTRIQELATNISYDELMPFFGTALKKVGTRIVTMISLGVLLKITPEITPEIKEFVTKALEDKDELLVMEAKKITLLK